MMTDHDKNLGKIIKQQRAMRGLTLQQLGEMSGVSSSHLGRIERGERFPSGRILQKISRPLGFSETELFKLAGLLSDQTLKIAEDSPYQGDGRLDPAVRMVLSQEPVQVQRAVIGILSILKSMTKA
jgi:transcriptional regulator with XRE-family HTH domain